ncbi:MAG: response regulator [candidate division Zixibacteria bacterium]|nr:response regulator [candidate division Zixibacteria bacterium]
MSTGSDHMVLLVDDEENILNALKRLLTRQLNIEVITATSGEKALDILKKQPVSLIISDQRMPNMTGVEFLYKSQEISPTSIRVLLTGYTDINATIEAINKGAIKYYFNKPWDDEQLLGRIKESLEILDMSRENERLTELTKHQNEQLKEFNTSLEEKVKEQTGEIRAQHSELVQSFMETIKAFSTIIGLRFEDVGSHSQRVATLVRELLEGLKLDKKDYQDIFVAAFLHDIGKVSLSDRTIAKTPGQYSKEDIDAIARHPIIGQSCVYGITGFEEIGLIIRHHHEDYDGSGFPDGLDEQSIPLGSRVIRIADAFDNRAFSKGYPDMKTLNEAAAYLVSHSHTWFDPDLVKRFIDRDIARNLYMGEYSGKRIIQPNDLQEGMVIAEDVNTMNGMFLVPRGAKLSKGMISRIRKIHGVDPVAKRIHVFKENQQKKERKKHASVQDITG